jgi:hypothetical protein
MKQHMDARGSENTDFKGKLSPRNIIFGDLITSEYYNFEAFLKKGGKRNETTRWIYC